MDICRLWLKVVRNIENSNMMIYKETKIRHLLKDLILVTLEKEIGNFQIYNSYPSKHLRATNISSKNFKF